MWHEKWREGVQQPRHDQTIDQPASQPASQPDCLAITWPDFLTSHAVVRLPDSKSKLWPSPKLYGMDIHKCISNVWP